MGVPGPTDLPKHPTTFLVYCSIDDSMALPVENEVHQMMAAPDFDLICNGGIVNAHLPILKAECKRISVTVKLDPTCKEFKLDFDRSVVEEALVHIYDYFFVKMYIKKGIVKVRADPDIHWKCAAVFEILLAEHFLNVRCYFRSCDVPVYFTHAPIEHLIRDFDKRVEFLLNPEAKCANANLAKEMAKAIYDAILVTISRCANPVQLIEKLEDVKFDHDCLIDHLLKATNSMRHGEKSAQPQKTGAYRPNFSADSIYYFIFFYCKKNPERIQDVKDKFLSVFPNSGYLACNPSSFDKYKHWKVGCFGGFHAMYERLFDITAEDAFVSDIRNGFFSANFFKIRVWDAEMMKRYSIDPSEVAFDVVGPKFVTIFLRLPRVVYDELGLAASENK